jgi:hypothetical protein
MPKESSGFGLQGSLPQKGLLHSSWHRLTNPPWISIISTLQGDQHEQRMSTDPRRHLPRPGRAGPCCQRPLAPTLPKASGTYGGGVGVCATAEIVDLASEAGLIEKSGAYYSWNGERIAQSRDKACQRLAEHPDLAAELREKLVALRKAENARLGAPAPVTGGESEAA